MLQLEKQVKPDRTVLSACVLGCRCERKTKSNETFKKSTLQYDAFAICRYQNKKKKKFLLTADHEMVEYK